MAEIRLVVVLLVLMTTCIYTLQASDSNSSVATTLGVLFERAPESAVAPKGDEVVFECELNLKPDRLEWRFRRGDSSSPIYT